ncbi:MAG: class I SAM-dependent methyltransferase [Henriciella sp.]
MNDATEPGKLQEKYYTEQADSYDNAHVNIDDEHMLALSMFSGFKFVGSNDSILDVGAGTGRAIKYLQSKLPKCKTMGIEPVEALRNVAYQSSEISREQLVDGDATNIQFDADQFDWVIETGVLHHIKDFRAATHEMCRVAKKGVLLSDSNNMGQGGRVSRLLKQSFKALGAWDLVTYIQTKGKMYKYSEGDGVYYSFCVFDTVPILRSNFRNVIFFNTSPSGLNIYNSSSTVGVIAYDKY